MLAIYDPALQVRTKRGWAYVFCRKMPQGVLVVTTKREKAQVGNEANLRFFEKHFGSETFRIEYPNRTKEKR